MIDDSVKVMLDNEPAVIETNATFSCFPGQTFSGPHRSTCMENGEWEPDPQAVKCIGETVLHYVWGRDIINVYQKLHLNEQESNML